MIVSSIRTSFFLALLVSLSFILSYSQDISWIEVSPSSGYITCVDADKVLNYVYAGTVSDGIFRSSDNGISWVEINSGLIGAIKITSIVATTNNHVYCVLDDTALFRSTNHGNQWARVTIGLNDSRFTGLSAGLDGKLAAAGGYYSFIYSTDGGATWASRWDGGGAWLKRTFIDASGNFYILGISWTGAPRKGYIFISTNQGANWTELYYDFPTPEALFSYSPAELFFGDIYGHVNRSTDAGLHWNNVFNFFTVYYDTRTVSSFIDGGYDHIFAGAINGGGVAMSTDRGSNWKKVNAGLTDSNVISLAINTLGYIFAATTSSIFRSSSPVTSVDQSGDQLHQHFSLLPNYPNPFNSTTIVTYNVSHRSEIRLEVFNVLGSKMETLSDGMKEPGRYTKTVDASNWPTGIYFIRMSSVQGILTRPILLIK